MRTFWAQNVPTANLPPVASVDSSLSKKPEFELPDTTDIMPLDPHVAQKITLRLDRNGHLVATRERTDVVEPIGVALVVLRGGLDLVFFRDNEVDMS